MRLSPRLSRYTPPRLPALRRAAIQPRPAAHHPARRADLLVRGDRARRLRTRRRNPRHHSGCLYQRHPGGGPAAMPVSVRRKRGHHRRRIAVLTEPVSLSPGQQPFATLKIRRRTPTARDDKTPAEKYGSTLAPTSRWMCPLPPPLTGPQNALRAFMKLGDSTAAPSLQVFFGRYRALRW